VKGSVSSRTSSPHVTYPRQVRHPRRRRGSQHRPGRRFTVRHRESTYAADPDDRSSFSHRLFLSATPHNGYEESFTSLLGAVGRPAFRPYRHARREAETAGHGTSPQKRHRRCGWQSGVPGQEARMPGGRLTPKNGKIHELLRVSPRAGLPASRQPIRIRQRLSSIFS